MFVKISDLRYKYEEPSETKGKHDKENTPAESPPPVTDGKPPNHSPMKGKNVF
jgi:hypothetical protein